MRVIVALGLVASAHAFLSPSAPQLLSSSALRCSTQSSAPQHPSRSALRTLSRSAAQPLSLPPSVLRAAASEGESSIEPVKTGEVDWEKFRSYFVATAIQVGFICAFMAGLENVGHLIRPEAYQILAVGFFAFMSLRSRVFSVLDASRPDPKADWEVKRPSWTPPRMAFPVIWSSIAVLRTVSSYLIWDACGRSLVVPPIIAMMTHLSIGDTWNSITNVEKRRGTSFGGVPFVWGSVVTVVAMYYATLPLAGLVLAPSAVWLSVASVLIYSIWKLNGEESLLPLKLPEAPESKEATAGEAKAE